MAIEDQVRDFYDERGWQADSSGPNAVYGDAQLWEDLRPCAAEYVSACRRKVLEFLDRGGELILDAGSGTIQYPEYLEYSRGFHKRVCVDVSQRALDGAREKLGARGDYVRASLLDLPFPDDHFDAAVTLHTIYHVDKDQQETAVRELVRVLKPGATAVVVYANPDRLVARLKALAGRRKPSPDSGPIYFFAHPLAWWRRFSDEAAIQIVPWRSLNANESRRLIPDNAVGVAMFRALLRFERTFPRAATQLGCYPMIVLTKQERT
jgi:SAM-dependent methyltransferase